MKLSPENILRRSGHGFLVYQYILRQYFKKYSETEVSDWPCPVRNPFTGGSRTLMIELHNGMAVHRDLEQKDFRGDAFDFANLHFKCDSREGLYYMINQALNLGLRPEPPAFLEQEDDSWRPRVSYFLAPISNTRCHEILSLPQVRDRIKGQEYEPITRELRQLKDKKAQRELKASRFSYVTFSGTFTKRNEQALLQHSGLVVFDFDHLAYLGEIKRLLLEDPEFETEMLFVSPSGDGLKWIIRFDPEKIPQRDFFREVTAYLHRKYRFETDASGKDVSRACFLPFDPEVYLHPRHETIERTGELRVPS